MNKLNYIRMNIGLHKCICDELRNITQCIEGSFYILLFGVYVIYLAQHDT